MADTRIRSLKATSLLRDDHRRVKQLFSEIESLGSDAEPESKMELFEEIKHELDAHATVEEEIFYPAIEELGDEDAEATRVVSEAREAHENVRILLDELSRLEDSDESFDGKVKILAENVAQHAEDEEEILFPFFDRLAAARRGEIAEELRSRKAELLEEEEDEGE
jgi:hemerythrin superfamily protein